MMLELDIVTTPSTLGASRATSNHYTRKLSPRNMNAYARQSPFLREA